MLFIAAVAAVMSIEFEVVVLVEVESANWKALSMLFFGLCICWYVSIGGEKKEGK